MLFCYYLFLSLFLILHVKTEVNEVEDVENVLNDHEFSNEVHDLVRREARRKKKTNSKIKQNPIFARRSGASSRQSIVLEGEHCQYIDFATARTSGSGCVDGTKMVIRNRRGHRKQFLIADSKTIYAFVQAGGKKFATDCTSGYTDRTCEIQCKAVTGLDSISLSRSARKEVPQGRIYNGGECEWIDLNKVNSDGVGCGSGFKFVVKPQRGIRRQFLFVEGKTILAFVRRGNKFAGCDRYTEVTSQVDCRAVANLGSVTLPASCGGSTEGILTVGGHQSGGPYLSTAEIFNPRSGRSCKIGDLPVVATGLSLCGNLACGGHNSLKSCSLFDGAGTFTALTVTLREQRAGHLCWQLQSGSVLLLGDSSSTSITSNSGSTTERLSADGLSSTADFNLPYDIRDACGIELNGKFIVTGGSSSEKTVAEFTYLRPETGQVTYLADLREGRRYHACSKFVDTNGDNALLVTGGRGGRDSGYASFLDSTEILSCPNCLNSQWSFAEPLPTARLGLTASTIQNTVYVSGGWGGGARLDIILRYNPSTSTSNDTWTEAGQLTEPKQDHASITVADISQFNEVCP